MELEKRKQIDEHLRIIAGINANIGVDSTPQERMDCKNKIAEHLKEIKKIDLEFWELICPDKKDKY